MQALTLVAKQKGCRHSIPNFLTEVKNNYFDFLKYCLTSTSSVPTSAKCIDWAQMQAWAAQQTIVGIIYGGIHRSGKGLCIPFNPLMEWIGYAQQIENQNRQLNKKCIEVISEYGNAGFSCLLLKGQGNAAMYPQPLLRQPGDIDILLTDVERKKIIEYVRGKHIIEDIRHHHLEYNDNGVPVEIHFIPCQMNNPIYHLRLMKWLAEHSECQLSELPDGAGKVPIPTYEYNMVFQLAHMMHHLFDEGIGLRQMIDYYYLLKSRNNDVRSKMEDVRGILKSLNLYNFAGAVMYIMKEVLGLEDQYLIVPVDDRRGKTLLKEILRGGNFGQNDVRWKRAEGRWHTGKKYFLKIARNMKLAYEYPAEALCEPVFRTWHFFWRIAHK